jgi:hypothetical protein
MTDDDRLILSGDINETGAAQAVTGRELRAPAPADIEAMLTQARRFRMQGHRMQAIQCCQEWIAVHTPQPRVLALLGQLFREEDRHPEALRCIQLAIAADPANTAYQDQYDELIDLVFRGTTPTAPARPRVAAPAKGARTRVAALVAPLPTHRFLKTGAVAAAFLVSLVGLSFAFTARDGERVEAPRRASHARPVAVYTAQPAAETAPSSAVAVPSPATVPPHSVPSPPPSIAPAPRGILTIPNVVGMPALKAEGELTALGLLVITKAAQDPAQPVQVVLACDPKPGTQLARGAIVKIDVNQAVANAAQQAAAGIEVPACEGRDGREVVRELTRLGLTPKVSTEASRLQPAGYVLRTYPAAGERLSVGGELVLMLAR